jgi:hypothetical protein
MVKAWYAVGSHSIVAKRTPLGNLVASPS